MNKRLPGLALLTILSIMSFSQNAGRKIIDEGLQQKLKLCTITWASCQKKIFSLVTSMLPSMVMAGLVKLIVPM